MEEERLVNFGHSNVRKYGTLTGTQGTSGSGIGSSGIRGQDHLVKHIVIPSDTLQGLALKYGTTTEKIRRANRLFASDSLFLREYLMIPVSKEKATSFDENVSPTPNVSHRASIAGYPSSSNSFSPGSPDEKKSFDDFLSRVDTSVASIKKNVEKSSENSEFGREFDDIYTRRKPVSRLRQSASIGGVGSSSSSTVLDGNPSGYNGPIGETVVLAQGRKVRSSLQRLQRTQDDWFQL